MIVDSLGIENTRDSIFYCERSQAKYSKYLVRRHSAPGRPNSS